jgi:hypothetical protein
MWWILGVLAAWFVAAVAVALWLGRTAKIADEKEGVNDV